MLISYIEENPVGKILNIPDGIYYSHFENDSVEGLYRKITIDKDLISWVTVKNYNNEKSITIETSYIDAPYYIENCFIPNKTGYKTITEDEFNTIFNNVVSCFQSLIVPIA